ncbi:hypothetical protein ASD04_10310 [Devosia sp. Root436]|jgi:hypothetical protein|uniref:tripartite tricarboxylate transporter TctB family protein n=1 Tax=Devosia sp. Root436 TaxID=1736537 RepID=UPI0006F938F2|nr:tripartite tricarboxylate transporter TctB family protein [Devosia sp. Root436]KQX38017.1 hypothetical protein ASD04_10310 [Devosia sp. Root436]
MKISQDTALGGLFAVIGGIALLMAVQYPFGSAGRMGPGFFPVIIATLLGLTGIAILVRARLAASEEITSARWLPLLIVPGAVALFGLLVEKLGLPLAVMLLTVGAATASVGFQLSWKATAGAAAFSAVCALVFVKLLGLPIPIAGSWLPALGV